MRVRVNGGWARKLPVASKTIVLRQVRGLTAQSVKKTGEAACRLWGRFQLPDGSGEPGGSLPAVCKKKDSSHPLFNWGAAFCRTQRERE